VVFVNHVSGLGGAENSLVSLLRHLPALGVEPHAVVPSGPLSDRLHRLGLPVTSTPACRLHRTRNPLTLAAQYRWMRRLNATVRRVCAEVGADLVHANSLAAAVALAPRGSRLPPMIWHCRDLTQPPSVMRWLTPRCGATIAISRVVERHLAQIAPQCAEGVHVVYNGIDPEDAPVHASREQVRRALGVAPETPVVITVGQFTPWKNWDLLLDAAARLQQTLPAARWWMVGDDTYGDNAAYAQQIRAAAPANVVFTGWREDVPDLIQAADVLVHAATAEPLGRVILEAMLLGTACVAPAAGGIPELLEAGRSGWLVEPRSAAGLAQGAEELLHHANYRRQLAAEAQSQVRERFSGQRAAEETVRVYREVLGDTGETPVAPGGDAHADSV
jgi:glycosyltransferase involved in cell wall biosynthesis